MKHNYGSIGRAAASAMAAWGLFTAACGSEPKDSTDKVQDTNSTSGESGGTPSGSTAESGTTATQTTDTTSSTETVAGPQCPTYAEGIEDGSIVVLYTAEVFGPDPANVVGVIDDVVYFTANSQLQRVPLTGGAVEVVGELQGSSARLIGNDRLLWLREETDATSDPIEDDSSTADFAPPDTSDETVAVEDGGASTIDSGEATIDTTDDPTSASSEGVTSNDTSTPTPLDEFVVAPLSDLSNITTVTRGVSTPENILANDSHVIWSTRDPANIYHAPLSGEGTNLLVPGGLPTGSVIHEEFYYWMDFLTDSLQRVAVTGGGAEILTEIFYGGEMTAYGDAIFWADSSSPSIEKWTAAGGHEDLASFSNFSGPEALSAYADKVYFYIGFGSSDFYSIGQSGGEISEHVCNLPSSRQILALENYVLISTDLGLVRLARP